MATDNGIYKGLKVHNSIATYSMYRNYTDFGNLAQQDKYETGYQGLICTGIPKYIQYIMEKEPEVKNMIYALIATMELEFKGLDGLTDKQAETTTISDNINETQVITKVLRDKNITAGLRYTEKSGSLITRSLEFILDGMRDEYNQSRRYHGYVNDGDARTVPSYANEVWSFLYYATDSSLTNLERAVMLINGQFPKAELSIYNGEKGTIEHKELTLDLNCFIVDTQEVWTMAQGIIKEITPSEKADTKFVRMVGDSRLESQGATSSLLTNLDVNDFTVNKSIAVNAAQPTVKSSTAVNAAQATVKKG